MSSSDDTVEPYTTTTPTKVLEPLGDFQNFDHSFEVCFTLTDKDYKTNIPKFDS